MTVSESKPLSSRSNTSNSSSTEKVRPVARGPSPTKTTAPPVPNPNLHDNLTVSIRHKPNGTDSVKFLRNTLYALHSNLLSIPPSNIHVWIEANETTSLFYADSLIASIAACDAAGAHRHILEETWNSITVYHIRQASPTRYLMMLTTDWYLYRPLSIIALDEFLQHNPSVIYLRFTHAQRETTTPFSPEKMWAIDRILPTSEDYFTEHPHIYCLPCLRKHVYTHAIPSHVPNGNWPHFENNMLQVAKSRKKPFELAVTRDSFFCPITHPSLGELPNFPR